MLGSRPTAATRFLIGHHQPSGAPCETAPEEIVGKLRQLFRGLLDDDAGATAVEYALMVALIAAIIIGAARAFSNNTIEMMSGVGNVVAGS
jgi:Flp pilus assembly pilin Flp